MKRDVKPAMGCTGPVSVIYAAAAAREAIGGELRALRLRVDKDTYKNSLAVLTPGTPYMGIRDPAILGALYGKSAYGLEVIRDLGVSWDPALVASYANKTEIEILWDQKRLGIYIDVCAQTDKGVGRAVVAREHDALVLLAAGDTVLQKDARFDPDDMAFEQEKPINRYSIRELYDFACRVPAADIAFLQDAVEKNMRLARAGLAEKCGAGFGPGFAAMGDSLSLRMKAMAAAASDARMGGKPLSAMSCGGSGNVGITACVPLAVLAEELEKTGEPLHRAICLSYLLAIRGKAAIGRLSPMCACAIAASMGVAAGAVMLYGGTYTAVDGAIRNLLGSMGGVLCDGAKFGCAYKLANGAGTALDSALLALNGVSIPAGDGVVCASAEETLALVGRLAGEGMLEEDELLCLEMLKREKASETAITKRREVPAP